MLTKMNIGSKIVYLALEDKILFFQIRQLLCLNCNQPSMCFIIMFMKTFLIYIILILLAKPSTSICNPGYYSSNTICQKCPQPCLQCSSPSNCSQCSIGYSLYNQTCIENVKVGAQFCGDGVFTTDQCDDGNKIDGDGCSSICKIESGYTCKFGVVGTPSQCSYNSALTLSLTSLLKVQYSNSLTLTLTVTPDVMAAKLFTWSSISSLNLSGCSTTSAVYSSGTLTLTISYSSSIEGLAAKLTITPPTAFAYSFVMVSSSMTFTVSPTNGQAYYYSPDVLIQGKIASVIYQVCLGIGLFVLVAGAIYWPMVGVEFMVVLQMAFFAVSLIDYQQPVYSAAADISGSVNGYNYRYGSANEGLSAILGSMDMRATFLENCNFMLVIQVGIATLGVVIYGISKLANVQKKDQLTMKSMFLIFQATTILILFNITNVAYSLGLHALHPGTNTVSTQSQISNIGVFVLVIIFNGVFWFCYIKYSDCYTHFMPMFKGHFWCGNHPVIMCIYRFVVGVLMGALFSFYFRIAVILALQVGYFIYFCVKRPYKNSIMNITGIINEFTVCMILAMAAVYQFKPILISVCAFGWVEISFVMLACLMAFISLCKSIHIVYFKNRIFEVHPVDYEITQQQINENNGQSKSHVKKRKKKSPSPTKTSAGQSKKGLRSLDDSIQKKINKDDSDMIGDSNPTMSHLV